MSRKPAPPPAEMPADQGVAAAPHPLPQTGGSFTLVDGQLVKEAETAPAPAPETDR